MASNFKSSDRPLDDLQKDDVFGRQAAKPKSRFPRFREMISYYKSINALTRYLIHIIALIVIAGILVAAYEVFV